MGDLGGGDTVRRCFVTGPGSGATDLDSRPQLSRSTCFLVLSCGTSRLECCGITMLARTTPDCLMFHTSSEQKKTWRILWCLGPLATRLVQQDFPWEFWVVTRYFSASGWVLIQVLLVSSSVVSAWPLVSRAGHDGVLGCPVC
jgi:hypothetical protein